VADELVEFLENIGYLEDLVLLEKYLRMCFILDIIERERYFLLA